MQTYWPSDYAKFASPVYHRQMLELAEERSADMTQLRETSHSEPSLRLLVELPSRRRVFLENLRDLIFPPRLPELRLRSAPAPFWHDVFVKHGLPWRGFVESIAYHVILCAILISLGRFMALHPQPLLRPVFDHTQVIYYNASEYLPAIDTRRAPSAALAKADPEYAKQPIISVPREADNRSQTIVTPPNIKLKRDVRMPNIVAWSDSDKVQKPRLAIPPAPLTAAAEITRLSPRMDSSVVAPPPDAARLAHRSARPELQASIVAPPPDLARSRDAGSLQAPQPAVVAPPPVIDSSTTRQLGDINIGHTDVVAPAPQLPVAEQRAAFKGRAGAAVAPQVVPPPPSVAGAASGSTAEFGSSGRMVALNLHPAVGAPPAAPPGNRRGEFAATPEGHAGASGNPGTASGSANGAAGSTKKGDGDLPTGLYVGTPGPGVNASPVAGEPKGSNVSIAAAKPATNLKAGAPVRVLPPESMAKLAEPERAVFGIRKLYAVNVNMPNLNSAGGSWVIHFAELNQDTAAQPTGLTQPVALRMTDPGYPTQLIRENVSGTVIVYAVIRADGSVDSVRVLRGVDDRLDRYACSAVVQWKFQPATKNGTPVDVEATFQIPFRPPKLGTSF